MYYGIYKNARNASWQCLIDFKVNLLPVKVSDIAKSADITIFKNSAVKMLEPDESGCTTIQDNKYYIIYNDTQSPVRNRFTIAHELGHIFLGHVLVNKAAYRTFAIQNDTERAANIFARDLLAPACVLHELNINNAEDISKLCDISISSANYRAKRMQVLERRNAWYKHPLERQVRKQFTDFINYNK